MEPTTRLEKYLDAIVRNTENMCACGPVLRYDEQALTDEQKAQARENIDAASDAELQTVREQVEDVKAAHFIEINTRNLANFDWLNPQFVYPGNFHNRAEITKLDTGIRLTAKTDASGSTYARYYLPISEYAGKTIFLHADVSSDGDVVTRVACRYATGETTPVMTGVVASAVSKTLSFTVPSVDEIEANGYVYLAFEFYLHNSGSTSFLAGSYAEYTNIQIELDAETEYVYPVLYKLEVGASSGANYDAEIAQLQEGVASNTAAIAELNKDQCLPASWISQLMEIQKAQGKCFTFAVQTDTHFATTKKTSASGTVYNAHNEDVITPLKNLTKRMGFDFIANLGDLTRGYEFDTTAEMQADMTEAVRRYVDGVNAPVLLAIGNHEDNVLYTTNTTVGSGNSSLDEVLLGDELYAKIVKPVIHTLPNTTQNGKSPYYYVDFDTIRAILLCTRDLPFQEISNGDIGIENHMISEEQVEWFRTKALATDKAVIVMCHVPLVGAKLGSTEVTNGSRIVAALVDFKTAGGTVICCSYGHTHVQNRYVDENGINHLVYKNGGKLAEIVLVDEAERTVTTYMVGEYGNAEGRSFTY